MPKPRSAAAATLVLAGLAPLALGSACGRGSEPTSGAAGAAATAEPVVNETLGLTLDAPETAGFRLAVNAGATLSLVRPASDEREEARLTIEVGAPQRAGVNLIEAVNAQKAAIEGRPDGRFLGQVQLGSPIGTAFSTRGRYAGDDGREVEEVRLFAVHPAGDRLLSLVYRYHPAPGDTKERLAEAMAALGLVRAEAPPTDPAAEVPSPGGAQP
jgi:hypothetical protein